MPMRVIILPERCRVAPNLTVVVRLRSQTGADPVTGGSAQTMAEDSAAQARQQLAAVVCVDRFMATPDVGVQLTALKEITSSYAQSKFVERAAGQ